MAKTQNQIKIAVAEVRQGMNIYYLGSIKPTDEADEHLVVDVIKPELKMGDAKQGYQRLLEEARIASLKKHFINGGKFEGTVMLSLRGETPVIKNGILCAETLRIFDAQHRWYGLRAAVAENTDLANWDIPVQIHLFKTKKEEMEAFHRINTLSRRVKTDHNNSLLVSMYGNMPINLIPKGQVNRIVLVKAIEMMKHTKGGPWEHCIDLYHLTNIRKDKSVKASSFSISLKRLIEKLAYNTAYDNATTTAAKAKIVADLLNSYWDFLEAYAPLVFADTTGHIKQGAGIHTMNRLLADMLVNQATLPFTNKQFTAHLNQYPKIKDVGFWSDSGLAKLYSAHNFEDCYKAVLGIKR